jgi:dihydropyrimidinase
MNAQPLLIVNGTLVNASTDTRADIAVAEGKIVQTGNLNPAEFPGYKVIDVTDKLILPGGVDPHVHLALPTPAGNSADNFTSGSKAAISGGTTAFIDFVTPRRNQSLLEAFTLRKKEAQSSLLDFSLHMGISGWNSGNAKEVELLIKNEGLRSFKTYLAYLDSIGIDYAALEEIMKIVGPSKGIVLVHCEDGAMIKHLQTELLEAGKRDPKNHALAHPAEAEITAVEKVLELSAKTNCKVYIVHTSTGRSTELIRQAKKSGVPVFAETCPQYLLLDDSVYFSQKQNNRILPYIISPPIRTSEDQDQLWNGIKDGTFDTVATDHCPFNLHGQKEAGAFDFTKIPNGAGGIEHRLTLLYTYGILTKTITLQQFVNLTSTQPAEIFGLGHRKGKLEAGFDADLVIWDPDKKDTISVDTHYQQCDSEIYEGFPILGKPEIVIVNGMIVFEGNSLHTDGLSGRCLLPEAPVR